MADHSKDPTEVKFLGEVFAEGWVYWLDSMILSQLAIILLIKRPCLGGVGTLDEGYIDY